MNPSFTLLDDSHASTADPTSRLYTDLYQVLSCTNSAQFEEVMEQMQAALQQELYAVAVLAYELNELPSHILLYKNCQKLTQLQVTDWLQQQIDLEPNIDQVAGIANLKASVNEQEFTDAIDRIQTYITFGDTYQVNYTFRFHFQSYGNLFSLYQRLRLRQPVPFGALIAMPDGSAVLSLSPELFIRHSQGNLFAQPMKGTTAASVTSDEKFDMQMNGLLSKRLSLDQKNRAENVMIVDLLRNDLGRIAQPGSIQVPQLFDVQRYNAVLQMTSSVTARCRDDVNLIELLRAIYPCGSITGAPKIRTMEIIHELETEPRGFYTGAIGWFDPIEKAEYIPEFCLSVPIRTMQLQPPTFDGTRQGVFGVGAGIVYDSVASNEYQECLLKAQFVTELPAQFALFETMYATKECGYRHWNYHLSRLQHSARYFGIPLNVPEIEIQLRSVCNQFVDQTAYRIKLSVNGVGQIQIEHAVLAPIKTSVQVLLASKPLQSNRLWLQHKTTQRNEYDQAWQLAESQGAFDMLFCNEQGELTEGGRSNVLVKMEGRWYTPPLSAGVLPGVMRAVLLADPDWDITEQNIHIEQLKTAEQIAVCNALRGVLLCSIVPTS